MFAGFCQSEGESFSCHRGGELGFIRCQLTTDALPHSTNDEILGTRNLLRNLSVIQVKETFGTGKQESSEFSTSPAKDGAVVKNGGKATSGEEKQQQSGDSDAANTLFGKLKSIVSSVSPNVFWAFQKLKEAKPLDLAKKGFDIVKDELSGNQNKRKQIEYGAASSTPSSTVERSTRTDIAVVPTKQSKWSKKFEAFKEKVNY